MKFIFFISTILLPLHVLSQDWQVNMSVGSSLGRLIPSSSSTARNAELRYVLMGTGIFASAALQLKAGSRHGFSICTQLASTPVGIRHTPEYIAGPVTRAADVLFTRSVTFGYTYYGSSFHRRVLVSATARAGMVYTSLLGLHLSTSSGLVEQHNTYAGIPSTRLTGKEVVNASFSPIVGLVLQAGPQLRGTVLENRLSLYISSSAIIRSVYTLPTQIELKYATNNTQLGTVARFSGAVFICQIGVDYVLFRKNDKYL